MSCCFPNIKLFGSGKNSFFTDGALYGLIPFDKIDKLSTDNRIFMIDPGPIDAYVEYEKTFPQIFVSKH